MINHCTFRPALPGSSKNSEIRIRCRDYRFIAFHFADGQQDTARDVYESIRGATCKLGKIENIYAFHYRAPPPEREFDGWSFYDAKAEWKRQGISEKGLDRGWRISRLNADYAFSPTYPALLVVPSSISDNTLNYAGRYRSRVRVPALTYLHPVNNCSLTRCAQPMVGLRGNRSIQDEKLVSACFSASASGDAQRSSPSLTRATSQSSLADEEPKMDVPGQAQREDEYIKAHSNEFASSKPQVYGAQQQNLIVDARPAVNAMANVALGRGTEKMEHYSFATKIYLNIDNIHVMRDSLNKVVESIKEADMSSLPPNRDLLAKSGWLKHIAALVDGSSLIARQIAIQHSHVLLHCSDGWDRTSQLSATAQLLLDPYFRTLDGFIVLIEKDWLSFGHMFQERAGYLNSEKWFSIEKDGLAGGVIQPTASAEGRNEVAEGFQNAFASTKRFFNRTANAELAGDSDGEKASMDDSPRGKGVNDDATKLKDVSPIFHQFLDTVYQLLRQFPTRFEFNERFLRRLFYHVYSCQYGTFLYNSEKSRLDARLSERTASVWAYFLARRAEFTNPQYDGGEVDDTVKGRERLLLPAVDQIRWWHELFQRTEQEMHGPVNGSAVRYLDAELGEGGTILRTAETAEQPGMSAVEGGIDQADISGRGQEMARIDL